MFNCNKTEDLSRLCAKKGVKVKIKLIKIKF